MERNTEFKEQLVRKNEKSFFGIYLKPQFNNANLFAIPLVLTSFTIISTFTNTEIIFMLRDPNYFNIPASDLGTVTNSILFFTVLANTLSTPIVG